MGLKFPHQLQSKQRSLLHCTTWTQTCNKMEELNELTDNTIYEYSPYVLLKINLLLFFKYLL